MFIRTTTVLPSVEGTVVNVENNIVLFKCYVMFKINLFYINMIKYTYFIENKSSKFNV